MSALVIPLRAARNAVRALNDLRRPDLRRHVIRMVVSEVASGGDGMEVTRILAQHRRQMRPPEGSA